MTLRKQFRRVLLSSFLAVFSASTMAIAQEVSPLKSGIELEHFDKSVPASDDFFQHVNGKWLKETKIPGDQSNYGSFTILDIQTKEAIKKIIEEAGTQSSPSPIAKQVGDFYKSYTNIEARNAAGLKPIGPILSKVREIQNKEGLLEVAGSLARRGIASFFSFYIEPDAKRSDEYAVYVNQDGITLPDRD
jgi:putative endopeptidase